MTESLGLGKLDRERLTALLRASQHTISTAEAEKTLKMSSQQAAKLLSRWANKGWLSRIKRGLYIPVPLESATTDIPLDDPWIVANRLYHPCYIGGWSAAEHWGLTEQIFRTIVVITTQKPRNHQPVIKGTHFLLRCATEQAMFGLKAVWHGQVKILVSDPTRTLLDLLAVPKLGGGIRSVCDMLVNYLACEYKDLTLLIEYAKQLDNGSVFKRLGFLLELYAPTEATTIERCKSQLTTGKVKLDPQLAADKLVTRWQLWVPKHWKE